MDKDKRVDCKYGVNCYQKNSAHHEKYKHPPKSEDSNVEESSDNKATKNPFPQYLKGENEQKRLKKSPSASGSPTKGNKSPEEEVKQKSSEVDEAKGLESSSKSEERKEMDITQEYEEVMKNLSNSDYFEIYQKRVRYSQKAEYLDLLKTPEMFIRHKFLVEMPTDFYKFWEFCKTITKDGKKPQSVLEKFGLKLAGPFDYLAGNFHDAKIGEPGDYTRHWRFFYDPPEFQTIFVKQKTGIHYGYWRDDPKDKDNLLMARNDASKGCEFEFVGGNSFETVLYYLAKDCVATPFNRVSIDTFIKSLQAFTSSNEITLDNLSKLTKKRNKNVVCQTFHKAGLVVPYDRKADLGYRSLVESDSNLKKILAKFEHAKGNQEKITAIMDELQPVITAATIAVDECDFGTSVELGIDLFCSGFTELHSVLSPLLISGYSMLRRPQFIAIMKTHLEFRRRDFNLSIFE